MEFVNNFVNRQRNVSLESLLYAPITLEERKHLKRVYTCLAGAVVMAGVGVYSHIFLPLPMFLSFILELVCVVALLMSADEANIQGKALSAKRCMYFGGFAFLFGNFMGNFIHFIYRFHPGILPTAFFGSLAIFSCFSAAAIFAKQRKYLYLGSILSSCLVYFSFISLFNLFFQSKIADCFLLYASLIVYMGLVVYHTQVTLEDFRRGKRDCLSHALQLYMDLVAIFIRLCVILLEKEEKKNNNQRKKN